LRLVEHLLGLLGVSFFHRDRWIAPVFNCRQIRVSVAEVSLFQCFSTSSL